MHLAAPGKLYSFTFLVANLDVIELKQCCGKYGMDSQLKKYLTVFLKTKVHHKFCFSQERT